MPAEITMPQLSDTMTEGTVVKWLKKEGDKVKEGEVVAEIETDKAVMEYESPENGTLAAIVAPEGQKVPVGQAIAVIATAGEKPEDVKKQASAGGAAGSAANKAEQNPEAGHHTPSADKETDHAKMHHERVQARAEQTGAGTHPEPRGGGTAVMEAPTPGRIKVSPLARRIAEQNDVDLSQVQGSGPGGRIIQRDVEAFLKEGGRGARVPARMEKPAEARPLKPEAVPVLAARVGTGRKESIALSKMRSTIALRLQQSKQQVPHFYETVDIDMEQVSHLRKRLNEQLEQQNVRLSLNDFVIKAVALSLLENPAINATFDGQTITRYGDVNLGLAVALPEGLIVPVLRNVDQMSLREIRARSADLYDRARAQRLKRDELSGATFSISSLGTMGVREFSAIINPPEVGILAVGSAQQRPAVVDKQVVPRTIMTVTLSADHRAVDGATAAEFLRTLRQLLEEPGMMLA